MAAVNADAEGSGSGKCHMNLDGMEISQGKRNQEQNREPRVCQEVQRYTPVLTRRVRGVHLQRACSAGRTETDVLHFLVSCPLEFEQQPTLFLVHNVAFDLPNSIQRKSSEGRMASGVISSAKKYISTCWTDGAHVAISPVRSSIFPNAPISCQTAQAH